jgi:hypothetical protein
MSQQGWLFPPHALQVPPRASLFPVQQLPAAQPRLQGVSWNPLPSLMHCLAEVPSHVRPWFGLQALQRSAEHPSGQFRSIQPEPSLRQVRSVDPEHILVPGSQALQARRTLLQPAGQVSLVAPVPSVLQVSSTLPLQIFALGRQTLHANRVLLHPSSQP